ncbi:hypothetical protein [Mycobacteroides abscessus]|uniref:Uncharacterized protein n=1 Tax=Mycobacteroides abscessus subsp. massiliense TaxID=1962118 RepID=A0A1T8KJU8_9MYCO|nr:hypothetical protein [Mycobacteroides abscessus]SKL82816.1 Uncharacterised protein [Mycobacteroides abscessus subsp. massiliense]SKS92284.1 Uncharacterised protein [Mycobacteroides abscessus subsp. massiliense]SKT19788.1 Uncharacterised protein [Mycobacteroides abscessus subsp. massiliense]SKW82223.1 Uncharacterised protein [Mycobacteroides abscessus subsp. massiliense]SLC05974.1 Uncharacterised protein [Mycobacteroides abscessus subsp. massiliense]
MKVQLIRGQITTTDGVTRKFQIAPLGWMQWGTTYEHLGETVDLIEALAQVAAGHITEYGEQP